MRQDPSYERYLEEFHINYRSLNQQENLASYFLDKSHKILESLCPSQTFEKVLELGAGPIPHIDYVQHSYNEYWITDLRPLHEIVQKYSDDERIFVEKQDATKLVFPESSFVRIIAVHLLEHLPNPHDVLREWMRVLKPDGILSIVLPCYPGLLWDFGRRLGPRRRAVGLGIDYDYWMAREHVNSIQSLTAFLKFYFKDSIVRKLWYPALIPSPNLNIFYISHIRKC